MPFKHSKGTAISLGDADLTSYTNSVEWTETSEASETTTLGKDAKTYEYGLDDGTASLEGYYDSTEATGPGAVIRDAKKAKLPVAFAYMPEGDAVGLPVRTVNVIITSYVETSAVPDMITFSAELQFTGEVVDTVGAV